MPDLRLASSASVVSGGGSFFPSYISGKWISARGNDSGNGGGLAAGRTFYTPFWVDQDTQFDALGVFIINAAAAGGTMHLGVLNHSLTTGGPGTVLLDAGTTPSTVPNTLATITKAAWPGGANLALSKSTMYYLAVNFLNNTTGLTYRRMTYVGSAPFNMATADLTNLAVPTLAQFDESGTSFTPSPAFTLQQGAVPAVSLRVA